MQEDLPQSFMAKLKDLEPNEDNPRIIKDAKFLKLVASLKQFPQMLKLRPIVVNIDMVILGGNMRYRAAMEAGLSEVPVLIADELTAEQQLEFIIKDNVGFGEWDFDELANTWDSLPLSDWGLDVPKEIPEDTPEDGAPAKAYKLEVIAADEEKQDEIYCKLIEAGYDVRKK